MTFTCAHMHCFGVCYWKLNLTYFNFKHKREYGLNVNITRYNAFKKGFTTQINALQCKKFNIMTAFQKVIIMPFQKAFLLFFKRLNKAFFRRCEMDLHCKCYMYYNLCIYFVMYWSEFKMPFWRFYALFCIVTSFEPGYYAFLRYYTIFVFFLIILIGFRIK